MQTVEINCQKDLKIIKKFPAISPILNLTIAYLSSTTNSLLSSSTIATCCR